MTHGPRVPYGRQCIDEDDVQAVVRTLRGDLLTTGPAVAGFEHALAREVDARHAFAVSSGTAALHLAARALGLGAGDQVIVPAVTFLATANAFVFEGAEIVFSDVSSRTGLMDAEHFVQALGRAPRARAVVIVHLNGQTADVTEIRALAHERGLHVIEDACHALGASYADGAGDWHRVGACAHSDVACFSFHPVKTIAMGEGGAVTLRDDALAERVRLLRNHGMQREPSAFVDRELSQDADGLVNPWYYEMVEPGFNYRASDLHCALGLSQLGKLSSFIERRAQLVASYDELLAPLAPAIVPVFRRQSCHPAWHLYVVHIDFEALGTSRGRLMRELNAQGFGTQVHYLPLHLQPYYRQFHPELSLPGAQTYYARCLSLPLFVGLGEEDVRGCVDALSRFLDPDEHHHA